MTQIAQGAYRDNMEKVMPAYSSGTVLTADSQVFSGAGYLMGVVASVSCTDTGDGTLVLYNNTTTAAATKILDVVISSAQSGLESKQYTFASPVKCTTGLLADLTNLKCNIYYRA